MCAATPQVYRERSVGGLPDEFQELDFKIVCVDGPSLVPDAEVIKVNFLFLDDKMHSPRFHVYAIQLLGCIGDCGGIAAESGVAGLSSIEPQQRCPCNHGRRNSSVEGKAQLAQFPQKKALRSHADSDAASASCCSGAATHAEHRCGLEEVSSSARCTAF